MIGQPTCPACSAERTTRFFALRNVPVLCNLLHETEAAARATPKADIELGYCRHCGLVYNTVFDSSLLDYSQEYETSLHFSNRFQSFAESLAGDLLDRYGRSGKTIVEIGAGEGEFLQLLTSGGRNECIGFDKSASTATATVPGLRIVNDYYSPEYSEIRADLVCCRHVLEHVGEPGEFLRSITGLLGPSSSLYFEVPDAMHMLSGKGVWDIIYEHPSYFTAPSLLHLFRDNGYRVTRVETVYGGQFLSLEARISDVSREIEATSPSLEELEQFAKRFVEQFSLELGRWSDLIETKLADGERVAVWGAGSKGVTFLNCVNGGGAVTSVIDISPRKQGRFVPGTGQEIRGPESIVADGIDLILVMNPIYTEEIETTVRDLGSAAEVVPV